jgi:hypothetical protein
MIGALATAQARDSGALADGLRELLRGDDTHDAEAALVVVAEALRRWLGLLMSKTKDG